MRTKQLYPGIKNSQKIRVIMDGVGIHTTVAQVQGIFMDTHHRIAAHHALTILSDEKHMNSIASRWNGIDYQVDLMD